jgi:hypothetical protein
MAKPSPAPAPLPSCDRAFPPGGLKGSVHWPSVLIPLAIKNLLNGERFWRRPALRAGRRRGLSPGPAARRRRAAAPHNTTESHSEILFLPDGKTFVRFGPAILLR